MKLRTVIAWSALIVALAGAREASAQSLALRIENGLVTLDASNVTVDEILARWTAVTGLSVVSKSGIGSEVPVTLQLSGVSEREALQTVLRDLSGYIMGERRDPRTGAVTIDRLLILPSSAAQGPATATAAAAPPRFAAGRRLGAFARRAPVPSVVQPSAPAPEPTEFDAPVELAPAPGGTATGGRLIGSGPGAVLDLTGSPEPNVDPGLDLPAEPPAAAPPSPFGNSRGAARPGQMTPGIPVEVGPQIIRSMSAGGPPRQQATEPPPPAPEP
jgi:hypothetical protein